MDALETALAPLVRMINRQIVAKTPAQELCTALDGRSMAVRVSNTGLAASVHVDSGQLVVSSDLPEEPDVALSGSLLSLMRLAGGSEQAIRDGSIDLVGDAETADQFRALLAYGKPDLEEELSSAIGDVAAHSVGRFARRLESWGRDARSTMRQNVSEYLQEESGAVPSRFEVEKFGDGVNSMRDAVDRFEARLQAFEKQAD